MSSVNTDQNQWHVIGLPEFEVVSQEETDTLDYIYTVKPAQVNRICSLCGSKGHIHKSWSRKVRDLPQFGHRVGLIIQGHTYKCSNPACHHLWPDEFTSIYPMSKMTVRLRDTIKKETFFHTFKSIADTYGVEQKSVKQLFDEYASELNEEYEIKAPKVLGIDEVHLKKRYCGVFVDINNGQVLEITPDRSKKTVKAFINSLDDRKNIKCVTMDMWRPYRDAVKDTLPKVPIVIDKFHVIKELNKQLDSVRSSISKGIKEKKERTSLKNNRFLLLTSAENLTDWQSKKLEELFKLYPDFEDPYALKEAFRDIYLCETRAEAEKMFEEWIQACTDANFNGYDSFIDTVLNWKTEIFNYFDYPYTNAETESLNRTISDLDKDGRGYSFTVLRDKIVLKPMVPRRTGTFTF